MITEVQPQAHLALAPPPDALRAGWVSEYRSEVPAADRWASGPGFRAHGLETQGRVFRMAELMAPLGIARRDLFTNLEEADRSVATAVDPEAIAKAGSRAIAPLLPLVDASIVICDDGGLPDLRAFGFDPISFDGHDPSAYAWALFELTMRARAVGDRQPCSCHPRSATSAIGLARL